MPSRIVYPGGGVYILGEKPLAAAWHSGAATLRLTTIGILAEHRRWVPFSNADYSDDPPVDSCGNQNQQ